ncbi:MAG TPA: hypothetical protein VNU46_03240 [Gemmatimonadaceae bacterium]|nr:hypothetical protein [Gemmatimonadaceae bacterium]
MPPSRVAAGMKAGDQEEAGLIDQIDEDIREFVQQNAPSLSGDHRANLGVGDEPGEVLEDDGPKFIA